MGRSVRGIGQRIEEKIVFSLHLFLRDSSWKLLLFAIVLVYLLGSLVVAALLRATANTVEGDQPTFSQLWYYAFAFTVGEIALDPITEGQRIVSACSLLAGLVLGLFLFGAMYEKFSNPRTTIEFADICCIWYNEDERPVLCFRYANLAREFVNRVDIRLNMVRRRRIQNTENTYLEFTELHTETMSAIGPSQYLMHVINEKSPLHYPHCREGFRIPDNMMWLGVSVSGLVMGRLDANVQVYHTQDIRVHHVFEDAAYEAPSVNGLRRQHTTFGVHLGGINSHRKIKPFAPSAFAHLPSALPSQGDALGEEITDGYHKLDEE